MERTLQQWLEYKRELLIEYYAVQGEIDYVDEQIGKLGGNQ